ncbi:uncharacterized protein METZ01_LOCUS491925, partial [marine metagenome]
MYNIFVKMRFTLKSEKRKFEHENYL